MRMLVTGNCGFIGQAFVRMFRADHSIVGLDKMGYASDPEAAKLCPTHRLDLGQAGVGGLKEFLDKEGPFGCVVNFAAESHVDRSIEGPEVFVHSNIVGAFNLLEALRQVSPATRFLQVGTDEAYGDLKDHERPFDNIHLVRPSSPYSASKTGADLMCLAYRRTFGMDVVITRSANNYGPRQWPEKLIPVIITRALEDREIPIHGSGMNTREWIHTDDNCRAIMAAIEKGEPGRVYNVGTGVEFSNVEMAINILKMMGKPPELIRHVEDRKGNDWRYAMDSKETMSLGWFPQIPLEQGLGETVRWYEENESFWKGNN